MMQITTKISVSEIRRWTNTIFDALELAGECEISFVHENYWSIYFDEAFDFSQEPKPVVGSLTDDIKDLRNEMAAFHSPEKGMLLSHACHHLTGIIKYLAETVPSRAVSASDETVAGGHHA